MARIRSTLPNFYVSGSMARVSLEARSLFQGLWSFMDDSGVHPADSLAAKTEVFPAYNFGAEQMEAWIAELVAQDCLAEFTVPASDDPAVKHFSGRKFWICVNWHYQRIDHPTPVRAPIRALWLASLGISDAGRGTQLLSPLPAPSATNGRAATGVVDAAAWDPARLTAREIFGGLGLGNAQRPRDRNLALKICYQTLAGRLPREWLPQAADSAKQAQSRAAAAGKLFRAAAYLTSIFKNKCAEANPPLDFRRILAECPEPPPAEPVAIERGEAPVATDGTAGRHAAALRSDAARKLADSLKPPPAERKKTAAEVARRLGLAAANGSPAAKRRPAPAPPVNPEADPILAAEKARKKSA